MPDFLRDLFQSPEGRAFLTKGIDAVVNALTKPAPEIDEPAQAAAELNRLNTYRALGLDPKCTDDALRETWEKFAALPPATPAYATARSAYLLICLWRGIEP